MVDKNDFENIIEQSGEIEIVMESGEVYEIHKHNYEFIDEQKGIIKIHGMYNEELIDLYIELDDIEHIRRHYNI